MNNTKELIVNKISECLKRDYFLEEVDKHKMLTGDYGINSLGILKLIVEIEEEFALMIPDEELSRFNTSTIEELADFISQFE